MDLCAGGFEHVKNDTRSRKLESPLPPLARDVPSRQACLKPIVLLVHYPPLKQKCLLGNSVV